MSQVYPQQGASLLDPEITPPEQGNEPQVQPKKNNKRSILGGLPTGGGRIGIIVVFGAIGVILMFVLIHTAPKKRAVANVGPHQEQQRAPQQTGSLPTDSAQTQQQGLNSSDESMTPDKIQRSTQLRSHPHGNTSGEDQATGIGAQHNNERLEQIPAFSPPPLPGSGTGQWTPQEYNAGSPSSGSAETMKVIAMLRREALTKASLTYVDEPHNQVHVAEQGSGKPQEAVSTVNNLGYQPGYHLATHLETVVSTAVAAPVIAVVDFDYQRDGITIVPAGSRLIGTMGASSSTGVINLHFNGIRMPNGNTISISAVGLNHQLMALKGIVTGKHVVEQFLMASLAGVGSTAAIYAGNNVNGQLTEADMLRTQAASNMGSNIDNQISTLQQSVSQSLVVTLPAGTEVEAMFTSEAKPQAVSAGTTTATRPQ